MPDNHAFYLLPLLGFVLGACVGSFVTMASWRLPRDEEIIFTPSHCTACNAHLTPRDLFPLFSWLFARGRCRHCQAPVSARYPLIECTLGIIFAALAWRYGASFKTLVLILLATELMILIVTDLEHTIIPDGVQVTLFFTGIAWDIAREAEWNDVFAIACLGLALGLVLHYGYKWLRRRDGLGWADVKFFCVAGIWLPLPAFVCFLFLSGILGTLTGILWRILKRGPLFPFGPALAVSLFINVLWPHLLQRTL